MRRFDTLDELAACVGQDVAVSDWVCIDQAMIDAFAHATGDHQWIHTDPERAATGAFWHNCGAWFFDPVAVAQVL